MSQDGRLIACTESGGPSRGDIVVLPIPGRVPVATVQTPFDETNGELSPDGRLLAYQSDESGRWEIYLLRIAESSARRSRPRAGSPPWSADGRTLFYRGAGQLVSVAIDDLSGRIGAPVDVLALEGRAVAGVAPDGRILLRRAAATPGRVRRS